MIREDQAHKHYDRNTPVIRKGDRDWKSDNHHQGRLGERYGSNPLSLIDQKIRQRTSREVDYALLPSTFDHKVGDVVTIPMENGRDLMAFRLVEVVEQLAGGPDVGGPEIDEDVPHNHHRKLWKYVWVEKNGALK